MFLSLVLKGPCIYLLSPSRHTDRMGTSDNGTPTDTLGTQLTTSSNTWKMQRSVHNRDHPSPAEKTTVGAPTPLLQAEPEKSESDSNTAGDL